MKATEKIKILFISHYPHLTMGGQRSMVALIENLDRDKYIPFAVVPGEGELRKRLESMGCRTFILPLTELKPKNFFKALRNLVGLIKIIKQNDIDILHPDHERDAFLSAFAKKFVKVKIAWHVRLTRKNNLDNYIVKYADKIICISEGARARFNGISDDKSVVIFNGVNCELFHPVEDKQQIRQELGIPADKFPVLFAGQIDPGKGVDDLLDAIKLLKKDNYLFIMAGKFKDEDYRDHVYRKIKAHAIDSILMLTGQQDNIQKWMQASEILILPSHEGVEGMGRVLFEAMACGCAVIGTDTSGVREAVFPGSGLLIPPHNPKAIAGAISELTSNKELLWEYQKAGRELALEHFDIRKHARLVEEVYEVMIKGNAGY